MPDVEPKVVLARQPRGIVKLDGEIITGWTSFEVENTVAYQADTFRIAFSLNGLPKEQDAAWLAQQSSLLCEIYAGFPEQADAPQIEELDCLMVGQVDEVNLDYAAGTAELVGRDLTARLIDNKVTENWLNHTASQMATQLAKRNGLMAQVKPTQGKIGSTVAYDTVSLHNQSEWDLLTRLARLYQYQVYVAGRTLHFAPLPQATKTPYLLRWQTASDKAGIPQFAGMALSLTRHLTVARDVTVIVQSYSPTAKRRVSVQYPTEHAQETIKPGLAQPRRQIYRYTLANQTKEQALRFAQAKHREITQHERRLSATLPANHELSARRVIQLTGTNTDFDQLYYPESIRRSLSFAEGYQMHIQAKNTSAKPELSR